MRLPIQIACIVIILLFAGCRKEIVKTPFEQEILQYSFSSNLAFLQPDIEQDLFKKHRIKSMSFITQRSDTSQLDSLTFVEFDEKGKRIRRTTKENVGVGCFPYTIKQFFIYSGDTLKRVNYYTFKYKTKSVLAQWMLKDTTKLNLFEWDDYSYVDDTIIIESGSSIRKFVKDNEGKLILRNTLMKANDQLARWKYSYINEEIAIAYNSTITGQRGLNVITVKQNVTTSTAKHMKDQPTEENIYDDNGLLRAKVKYKNGEQRLKTIVTYEYY